MKYRYETSCTNVPRRDARHLEDMIEEAREIKWGTFSRYVSGSEITDRFGDCPHVKDDYHVTFWKSWYKGRPCVYMVHSAIEYIWVKP